MKYKLFLWIGLMILLMTTIPALELKKEITGDTIKLMDCNGIWNGLNCMLGTEIGTKTNIAELKLITPHNNMVMRGNNVKVAEFQVNNLVEYTNVFKAMEFYNARDNSSINRNFTFKYKVNESYPEDIIDSYKKVCENITNNESQFINESCNNVPVYRRVNLTRDAWVNVNNGKLPVGNLTIGVFADVNTGDYVEWIPKLYDTRISEWATWTEGFNTGLVQYIKFDDTSGTTITENVYSRNYTIQGTEYQWLTGLINNGLNISGDNTIGKNGSSVATLNIPQTVSYNVWMKPSRNGSQEMFISKRGSGSGYGGILFWRTTDGSLNYLVGKDSGHWYFQQNVANSSAFRDNNYNVWHMLTITYNGSEFDCYIDGTLQTRTFSTGDIYYGNFGLTFGGEMDLSGDYRGGLDEFGIWNRTLTSSEVSNLYNGGSGISYNPDSTYPQFSNYLTNPANNTEYKASGRTFFFNTTATNTNGTVLLILNGTSYLASNVSTNFYVNVSNLTIGNYTYNWTGYGSGVMHNQNTSENINYVVAQNYTPTCVLVNRTPADINDSSTGIMNVLINCSDASGINITKIGDHYPFFITRTVDAYVLSAGIPNYWSVRYPNNSLAVIGNLTPAYKIWRALGRNEGYWYENLTGYSDCTGLSPCYQPLNDTFSYAIEDGEYGHFTITNGSNWALLNYTHPAVDVAAFRQSIYLSYESMVKEGKKNYTVRNNNYVLMKRFDAEAYRSTSNYTMNSFRNIKDTNAPSKTLRSFYCNSSYNVSAGIMVVNSPNCALISSLTATELNNVVFTDRNSSYSKGTYGIINGKFAGIQATTEFYIEYESPETGTNKGYNVSYVNGTTNTDIPFNQTNVTWTTTNGGVTWTQAPFTLDVFTTATREFNDTFEFGVYAKDNAEYVYSNFTFIVDDITKTTHFISYPLVLEYNGSVILNDLDLNQTHNGLMQVKIGVAKTPDSVGNVTHNLTLRNLDGSYNYTINGSFVSPLDADIWIDFNTSKVPDGRYRMNISAISGENFNDVKSRLTDRNFTIDNTAPNFTTIPSNLSVDYRAAISAVFMGNDTMGVVYYDVNDSRFTISSSGVLTNSTMLGAGTYILNVSLNDTANWNYTIYKITINKIASSASLTFDKASPQVYGTAITPTCTLLNGETTPVITLDYSINKTSGVAITDLNASLHNFNCTVLESQNFTYAQYTYNFNITKATTALGLDSDVGWTTIPFTPTIITGTGCPAELACILYKGIVNVTNPYSFSPALANYIFTFNTTGNSNYTSATTTNTLYSNYNSLGLGTTPCRYKEYGYYNEQLPWIRQEGCV